MSFSWAKIILRRVVAQWDSKCRFLGEKWMDVDHGYYLLLLGRAPQKAHNENRDSPCNFILFTCFVYILFLYSSLFFFSFPLFPLFYFFCQRLGGGGRSSPSPPSDPPLGKRGHGYKLQKRMFHNDRQFYSIPNRAVDCWNALPNEIIYANKSFDAFSRGVKALDLAEFLKRVP